MLQNHFITTEDWETEKLMNIINLASEMKLTRYSPEWQNILKNKTFIMLFYNASLRTHLSFEIAAHELGAHPIYRTPQMGWIKTDKKQTSGESIQDAIKVMSRYAHGIGIRLTLDAISKYGEGNRILREYAKYSTIPVINMADDMFHPCQGLADLMGWVERTNSERLDMSSLKGKKLLLTWASSGLARPFASVQSHLLLAARFGMNVTLAYPESYDLDPNICQKAEHYCKQNNNHFEITHDPDIGYHDADVVYARNWITPSAYKSGRLDYNAEVKKALDNPLWKVTVKRMAKTNAALFANPMPVDRGIEAEDAVIDSHKSVIYDVAENRLHIQKAVLALTMANYI